MGVTELLRILLTIFLSTACIQNVRLFGVYDVRWPFLAEIHTAPLKRFVPSSVLQAVRALRNAPAALAVFLAGVAPVVRKRPIWVKIGDVLSCVTLKFDGWPWKTIGHLSFAVSSFVQHFIAIGELKLELQSGNPQFGSNLTTFRAVWRWNLTDDLEKQ